jgi:hypothetical protein
MLAVVTAVSVIVAAYFSAYGLRHKYRDDAGHITDAGRLALRGIVLSTLLSLLSVGLAAYRAYEERTAAVQRLSAETRQYIDTLARLEQITSNTTRLSYPISSAIVCVRIAIPGNHPEFIQLRDHLRSEIAQWQQENTSLSDAGYRDGGYRFSRNLKTRAIERVQLDADLTTLIMQDIRYGHWFVFDMPGARITNKRAAAGEEDVPVKGHVGAIVKQTLTYIVDDDLFRFELHYRPAFDRGDPRLSSLLDLRGASLAVTFAPSFETGSWHLRSMYVYTESGYFLSVDTSTLTLLEDPLFIIYAGRMHDRPETSGIPYEF